MMKNALYIALTGLCLMVSPFVYAQEESGPLRTSLLDSTGKVTGSAMFHGTAKGILISVDISGFSPGWHGVHFHAAGDCADHSNHFEKAGGHAMKEGQEHGYLNDNGPHSGDLPNLWVHGDGTGRAEFYSVETSFADLRDADGSALMIHAATDDHITQPSGNSGARVACGVIGP